MNVKDSKDKNIHDHEGYELERLETGFSCKHGWYELRARGKLPEKRGHHSSVIYNGSLYIYGGEDSREGKFSNLWKINLDEFIEAGEQPNEDLEGEENKSIMEKDESSPTDPKKFHWQLIETTGAKPGALSHHKSLLKGDEMYLSGGMKEDTDSNPDLYCLNMKSYEWRVVHTEGENKPQCRDDHSMVGTEDGFYIFGGFVKGKRMNDLHKYTYDTRKWTCMWEYYEIDEFSKSAKQKQKSCPCPRSGQAMTYHEEKLYLFGGRNDYNDKLNDTWIFDISSKQWELIRNDKSPIGRSSHTLVDVGSKMILFGGIVDITKEINEIEQFDYSSRKWSAVDDKSEMHKYGSIPSPARREKLNETSQTKENNELEAITTKREIANKSAKKTHSKASLIESDEKDKNFHLLKDIPKKYKKRSTRKTKKEDVNSARNEVNTPITGNLKNTFLIKNHNEGFDSYHSHMKKKNRDTFKNSSMFAGLFNQCLKPCDRPTARDGHSCNFYIKTNRIYVFGGDRHHMPYNDIFCLELSSDL